MGKKCFVPNCKSGYASNKDKVSIFSAPKEEVLLNVWRKVIPRMDRVLTSKDFVCEKHFKEDDIIKEWTCGATTVPLQHIRLKKDAFPTLYPNCPSYLNIKVNKRRKIVKCDVPNKKKYCDTADKSLNVDDDNPMPSTSSLESIFNLSWTNINLPNDSWTKSKMEDSSGNYISFAKLSFTSYNGASGSFGERPFIEKQILLDENLNKKIFICHQMYENDDIDITSVEDLQILILKIDKLNICRGIFKSWDKSYKYLLRSKVSKIIMDTLRHKKCSVIISDGTDQICKFCGHLYSNLRKTRLKTSKSQKSVEKLRNRRKQICRLRRF